MTAYLRSVREGGVVKTSEVPRLPDEGWNPRIADAVEAIEMNAGVRLGEEIVVSGRVRPDTVQNFKNADGDYVVFAGLRAQATMARHVLVGRVRDGKVRFYDPQRSVKRARLTEHEASVLLEQGVKAFRVESGFSGERP